MSKKNPVGQDIIQRPNSFNYFDDHVIIQGKGAYKPIKYKKFVDNKVQRQNTPRILDDPNNTHTFSKPIAETTYDKQAKAWFNEQSRRKYNEERLAKINVDNVNSANVKSRIMDAYAQVPSAFDPFSDVPPPSPFDSDPSPDPFDSAPLPPPPLKKSGSKKGKVPLLTEALMKPIQVSPTLARDITDQGGNVNDVVDAVRLQAYKETVAPTRTSDRIAALNKSKAVLEASSQFKSGFQPSTSLKK